MATARRRRRRAARCRCLTKLLIANRGEIACRVARTARRMGIAHRRRLFRRRCRRAARRSLRRGVPARPAAAARELPRRRRDHRDRAARRRAGDPSRATASCPRTQRSPRRAPRAGIVFIGPPPAAIAGDGLEVRGQDASWARRRAAGAGLSRRRPGRRAAAREAATIGYPVLIKATAGGGGKGMKIVERAARLRRRARVGAARGASRLRRRPRADREIPDGAAPYRDPGLRRHARQRRPPVRARLLGAAAPPEGARGSARAGHDARAPRARWARPRSRRRSAIGYVGAGTVEFIAATFAATARSTSWR